MAKIVRSAVANVELHLEMLEAGDVQGDVVAVRDGAEGLADVVERSGGVEFAFQLEVKVAGGHGLDSSLSDCGLSRVESIFILLLQVAAFCFGFLSYLFPTHHFTIQSPSQNVITQRTTLTVSWADGWPSYLFPGGYPRQGF